MAHEPAPDLPDRVADRYVPDVRLGRGGMGSVWRVWDERLSRHVALKVVRADRATPADLARFEEEARVAATLQHPGIVPVHDLGLLDDGRLWFTMHEVHGESLDARIRQAHRAWRLGRDSAEGSVRRLLEAVLRVCETVAYAHARGVVHRDLKPANLMLGRYGEVFVLDWGLAKVAPGAPERGQGRGSRTTTRVGAVTGTPAYLSPEQAQGRSHEVTPPSDVYALGATLYDVLCERPPRVARTVDLLIAAIAEGTPLRPPSAEATAVRVDDELDRICLRALAPDPAARYAEAGALAADLAAWLDGAPNRDRADRLVREAEQALDDARDEARQAELLRAEARARLAHVPAAADPADKALGWAKEDDARQREVASRAARTRAVQALRGALSLVPDWEPAHVRLADLFHEQHQALEARQRLEDAEAVEADLRTHDRAGRYAAYLSGVGAVTLVTDVPVEVRLHRVVERGRRWVPELERALGVTPLERVPLPMGGWLLTLHRDGHEIVRYPVWLRRGEHWDGVPPGARDPHPVHVPAAGCVGPRACYVPAGWSWAGDDRFEHTLPLRRMWADGFVIGRDPVTIGEVLVWLNDLVARGDEAGALAAQPMLGDADEPMFARDDAGRFVGVRTDRTGPGWDALRAGPGVPAVCLDWHQARAYAAWRAGRDGLPWRLPMEREWQKAARGADRRRYPWGDHLEPAWCRMVSSAPEAMIVPVDAYPLDESPYGVRGLAGNVADWAADGTVEAPEQRGNDRVWVGVADAPQRYILGGTCGSGPLTCETAQRSRFAPEIRQVRVGFRLVRSGLP